MTVMNTNQVPLICPICNDNVAKHTTVRLRLCLAEKKANERLEQLKREKEEEDRLEREELINQLVTNEG